MIQSDTIKTMALDLGADTVGIAQATPVEAREKFLNWLDRNRAGDMEYLHKYQNERFDPGQLMPGAKSIIVMGFNYYDDDLLPFGKYKVARYARRKDYHVILRKIIKQLRSRLKEINPDLKGKICVDTAPFMEKYWARMAGLGWQGKNTILVSREFGSWLFLGGLIINDIADNYDEPVADHCGRCTRCLDACPTGAITKPYHIDATKCISYWTIESEQENIKSEIAKKIENQIFGCDICLDVCPFNKFQKTIEKEILKPQKNIALIESGEFAAISENKFNRLFKNTPLSRTGQKNLCRNLSAINSK